MIHLDVKALNQAQLLNTTLTPCAICVRLGHPDSKNDSIKNKNSGL